MSNNKVALVTGSSRGLGKDMAIQLAKKGFDVIVTYQSGKAGAEEVVAEIKSMGQKAVALPLDVAKSNTYDEFVHSVQDKLTSEFDTLHLHALVNNAGTGIHAAFETTTEEEFDQMVNIHLKAAFFLTQKLLPLLHDGSSIVNISSGLARFSFPNFAAYAIMKAGIESLTRYQALELGHRKIRVNTVAPGAIATDFGGGATRDNAEINKHIASQTALGRVGLPDDIGSVIAFLCSDESKWINAQRIEVSGGIFI